jgi:hypothetical protein
MLYIVCHVAINIISISKTHVQISSIFKATEMHKQTKYYTLPTSKYVLPFLLRQTKLNFTAMMSRIYFFFLPSTNKHVCKSIVIYSKGEDGKAFAHANCVFVHEAELSGRCNSSERMRPYSRVLYLVLFDTSLENESVTWCSKFKKK